MMSQIKLTYVLIVFLLEIKDGWNVIRLHTIQLMLLQPPNDGNVKMNVICGLRCYINFPLIVVGDVGASKRIQKLIVHVKKKELAMKL